jgi:glycosyltransferase involved in cell wall biosynthesis
VGRFTKAKGHHELIRIMPGLSGDSEVDLYIVGGVNPERDFSQVLRERIAELGLDNVHLIEGVDHERLPLWYGAADIFCLASKSEGCPNVVLEALACGTPVVATDVGAVKKVIVNGENGYLIGQSELASLERIVRLALGREWDRRSIAAGMESWGWAACAEKVVEIYREITGGAKSTPK